MSQNLQKILVSSCTAPAGLEKRIMIRVEKAVQRRANERIATGSAVSVFFAVILVAVGREMSAEIAASGFGQYLSLVFSNSGAILSNWQDFGWTVIESAPITGLALCLGMTGMFIAALRWTGKALGNFVGAAGRLAV